MPDPWVPYFLTVSLAAIERYKGDDTALADWIRGFHYGATGAFLLANPPEAMAQGFADGSFSKTNADTKRDQISQVRRQAANKRHSKRHANGDANA